jgi:hypothetical protein
MVVVVLMANYVAGELESGKAGSAAKCRSIRRGRSRVFGR